MTDALLDRGKDDRRWRGARRLASVLLAVTLAATSVSVSVAWGEPDVRDGDGIVTAAADTGGATGKSADAGQDSSDAGDDSLSDADAAGVQHATDPGEPQQAIGDAQSENADQEDSVTDEGKDSQAQSEDSNENAAEEDAALVSIEDAEAVTGIDSSEEGSAYVEGEVLVTFVAGTDVDTVFDVTEKATSAVACDAAEDNLVATRVEGELLQGEAALEPTAVVEVAQDVTVAQAVAELAEAPEVADAQPNYIYQVLEGEGSAAVSDEGAADPDSVGAAAGGTDNQMGDSEEAGLVSQAAVAVNDEGDVQNRKAWAAVGLYDAWSLATCNNAVAIAVIDTGCLTTHEDLASNIVATYDAVGESGDVSDVSSTDGHGTHVAGIAGAVADNGIGIAGASYNANLVVVKAAKSDGTFTTSTLASSCTWVAEHAATYNIRVANMSVGAIWEDYPNYGWADNKLCKAIDAADAAGVLTVCAAGNAGDGATVPYSCFPGDYDTCLSVMNLSNASDYESLNSGSNYNKADVGEFSAHATKDICAPGTSIYSTFWRGGYDNRTGTSMASPMVAGIAALCFAADPSLTPEYVKVLLEETATDLGNTGWDQMYGYGRVNAFAALKKALGVGDGAGSANPVDSANPASPSDSKGDGSNKDGAKVASVPAVSTAAHVQREGWQKASTAAMGKVATSGTSGKSLRLEAVKLELQDASGKTLKGAISYRTHVQRIGWQDWVSDGALAGTSGKSLRLEAIQIKLAGEYARDYDVHYRVHAQGAGWLDWACNGEKAGTAGYSYRLEALQVVIVKKGATPPAASPRSATASHFQSLQYTTHVQRVGWQSWRTEGVMAGTSGRALRLEGIKITLGPSEYGGGITYRTHVQRVGWQAWKKNGMLSGTSGKSLRLEGIQIKLTGEMAKHYDVYYRVHVQSYGWQAWKKNGQTAGTVGKSKRLEAIEIKLVPKS